MVEQGDIIMLAIVIAVCTGWLGWFVIDIRDDLRTIRKRLQADTPTPGASEPK